MLFPEIFPTEDDVFPIIDASFACPEAKAADNATAYLSTAFINISGMNVDDAKIQKTLQQFRSSMDAGSFATIDEPDDTVPMIRIAGSLYETLR